MNFIARLLLAAPLLAVLLVCAVGLCVYAGIAWIFTGEARVTVRWPSWD